MECSRFSEKMRLRWKTSFNARRGSMLGRRPIKGAGHGLFIDRRVGLLSTPLETTNSKGEVYAGQNAIRHIAIRSEDPDQLSSFYEKTFGLKVVRRNPRGNKSSIYMTDGFMHLAINASQRRSAERHLAFWFSGSIPRSDQRHHSRPSRGERARPACRKLYHRSSGQSHRCRSRHVADLKDAVYNGALPV